MYIKFVLKIHFKDVFCQFVCNKEYDKEIKASYFSTLNLLLCLKKVYNNAAKECML